MPRPAARPSAQYTFPAPVRGWIANEGLASAQPGGAALLENWFPTQRSIRLRGGLLKFATIGSTAVVSMFAYSTGSVRKLFATLADKIFDITSVADPSTPPAASVSGLTNGYFSAAQMSTGLGGDYLYAVNGADKARLFDGATWTAVDGASTPAITGVTTSTLSHVWVYRNRLFFIQTGTMFAWALPVDSIGGAAIQISLAGVFQKGGALLTGGTWSYDAGNGINDRCVFISTNGELAIFEGGDPASPTDWTLVGRYDISPVLGKKALMSIGGDLLIATLDGIVPISEVVSKDPAALSIAAITRAIEPEWRREVIARRGLNWEMVKFSQYKMGVVSLPNTATTQPYCFVVNLETGAWAKYTGWDTNCLALHDEWAYFGTSAGKIYKIEIGGRDDGALYVARFAGLPDHLRSVAVHKTVHSLRGTFVAGKAFTPKLSVAVNYETGFPSAPNSAADSGAESAWDVGLWDVAKFDASSANVVPVTTRWVSAGKSGHVVAPQCQVTCGVTATPDAELAQIDVIYETGEVMVE